MNSEFLNFILIFGLYAVTMGYITYKQSELENEETRIYRKKQKY
jgi:hypothetical protein